MANDNSILEPIDMYKSTFSKKIVENAEKFFDDLGAKTNTPIEENRLTVAQYNKKCVEITDFSKTSKKLRSKKGFLTFVEILFIVLGIFFIVGVCYGTMNPAIFIPVGIVLIALSFVFIFTISKSIKKKIRETEEMLSKLKKEAEELKQQAYNQMKALNASYDWDMANKLVNMTTPLFEMDNTFNPERFMFLHERFGLEENTDDPNVSTCMVQSGTILGNPFAIMKDFEMSMGTQTYTGSITITWTTTYRDSNGHLQTQHHTQTLEASVTKPKPYYAHNTRLVYGNEACPDLSFSRTISEASAMDDKQLAKYCDKFDKKLDKMVKNDIDDKDHNGSQFTRLHNTQFEAIFNATNRDNEVQFRMLFTPLAQNNEVKLCRNKEFYGDDFGFWKKKKINIIRSLHSQMFDYECDPDQFVHYSYDLAREKFINYMVLYFKSFYFDMAPLISIPLYQQTKTREYIYGNNYRGNVTSFEHEVMLNSYPADMLKPEDCATPIIVKSGSVSKNGNVDTVEATSHGFTATQCTDIVNKLGGDGKIHSIPVHWIRYDPISCTNTIDVGNTNTNLQGMKNYLNNANLGKNDIKYKRGFISLLNGENSTLLNQIINDLRK